MHTFKKPTIAVFILLGCLVRPSSVARADGGEVRLSEIIGNYRISIFTAPTPFRAGPVDISVLVQDAVTASPIPDAVVILKMTPRDRPSEAIIQTASKAAATNKLLQAAAFDLSVSGWWELQAIIDGPLGPAEARCQVEAAEPWPPWLTLFPWIAWPIIPIALFGIHLILVRRRSGSTNPS